MTEAALDVDWLEGLIQQLTSGQQAQMLRHIMRELQRRNAARIEGQTGPNGRPWVPRKFPNTPGKRSGPMLQGMAMSRHQKINISNGIGVLAFRARAAKLAQIHHFGLPDQPGPHSAMIDYPARQLLGLNDADKAWVADAILSWVAGERL